MVAEDDGRVVAFSAAIVPEDAWFLCSLFVHPAVQARGVGRRLLELSSGEGFARRQTIADSIQPISNGPYARRGPVPATPILGLEGRPRAGHPQELVATRPDLNALRGSSRGGLRFYAPPGLLLVSPGVNLPRALAISGYWLL